MQYQDGEYKLKHNHRYYTQVQLQMYICKVARCSFVVYTNKELSITEVAFDAQFCNTLVDKCNNFFWESVLPSIISGDVEQEEDCEIPPDIIKLYCIF
jgi:hypothetical protein